MRRGSGGGSAIRDGRQEEGGRPWCSLKRSPCEFEERYNGKPPHSSSSSDAARMKAKGVVHEKEKERKGKNGLIIEK